MAIYFAVFNRQRRAMHAPVTNTQETEKWESVKLLPSQTTAPMSKGGVEDALVIRLEASSIAEAQAGIRHFFPGNVTDTPVVIAEAQFKES
jgi:hypothetical protein